MNTLPEADIVWRSHWLQQALGEFAPLAPALEESIRTDVCIVGGGYLGLWTALQLKEERPELDITVIERDICGGGPSGRNSGMVLAAWSKFAALAQLRGEQHAVELVDWSTSALDAIETFCRANDIDCWLDRVGWIWGATCAAQVGAWEGALRALEKHDRTPARPVDREEIAALTGSNSHLAGVFDAAAATIQPAMLVRGLRRVALSRGVRIFEKTTMRSFTRRGKLVVETGRGRIEAGKLVLAMNAWSSAVPELAPAIFNIASDDAVSEPIPQMLEQAGYRRGPLMIDSRVFVSGYRTTKDGRLNVGVTGGHIGFGPVVDRRFHRPSTRVPAMRAALRQGHPALERFPLANSWCGPIDRTNSGLPLFGRFPGNPDILYGYGFSGNGIGMTHVGARILCALLLNRQDAYSECALVRPVRRGFPPEPFRFIGAHFVRGAVRRRDEAEHRGRRPDPVTALLAGLAPSGVTPSKANTSNRKATR